MLGDMAFGGGPKHHGKKKHRLKKHEIETPAQPFLGKKGFVYPPSCWGGEKKKKPAKNTGGWGGQLLGVLR